MLENLNEDKAGAEELFYEIVVENPRDIYEGLLEADLEVDEADDDEETTEATDEEVDESDDEEVDELDDEEVDEALQMMKTLKKTLIQMSLKLKVTRRRHDVAMERRWRYGHGHGYG